MRGETGVQAMRKRSMLVLIAGNGAKHPIHYANGRGWTACGLNTKRLRYSNFGTHRQVDCGNCKRANAYRYVKAWRNPNL